VYFNLVQMRSVILCNKRICIFRDAASSAAAVHAEHPRENHSDTCEVHITQIASSDSLSLQPVVPVVHTASDGLNYFEK